LSCKDELVITTDTGRHILSAFGIVTRYKQFYYRLAIGIVAGNIPATKNNMLGSIFGERRVLLPGPRCDASRFWATAGGQICPLGSPLKKLTVLRCLISIEFQCLGE